MHVLKSPVGDGKLTDGRDRVSCNFRLLARNTFSGPFGNVGIHSRPNDFGCDGLTCPLNPWMSQAVNGIEYGLSESRGDKGAGWSVTTIDYEVVKTDVDAFKI